MYTVTFEIPFAEFMILKVKDSFLETVLIYILILYYDVPIYFQVSYTFCKDFIAGLVKDMSATDFGRTSVLIKAFQRVSMNWDF